MNKSSGKFGLVGAGGQADETESYAYGSAEYRAVDPQYAAEGLISVDQLSTEQLQTPVSVAVGAPGLRRQLAERWRGNRFTTVISEHAIIDTSARIGEGGVVAHGAIITTNVHIGVHGLINVGATISHNSKLGDYVTVSPGVNIAGNVKVGDGVFIGIGATISNKVSVANGVVIGAGAVVIDDITEENMIYVGVPARAIGRNEGWIHEI